jgi:hypothetical protein
MRWWSIILTIVVPSKPFAFSGGDGSLDNPFQITTAEQLANVREYCNISDSGKHFKLINDIDLTTWLAPNGSGYNGGKFWQPIGDGLHRFFGDFDGNNHKITGVKINRPDQDSLGLFSSIGVGSKLRNIGVEIYFERTATDPDYVGGLVGFCDSGAITNCYASGAVIGKRHVGGLVGYCYPGTVINCYANDTVTGTDHVGGLVGYCEKGTVISSYATGVVSGTYNEGGLIGYCIYGSVSNSHATGAISGSVSVGGLVGICGYGTITSCYATGTISGTNMIGGLAGDCFHGIITKCYASGAVSCEIQWAGGLVGSCRYGTVTSSFATGTVSGGNNYSGGLIGMCDSGTVANCYAIGAVTGTRDVGGLVGYSDTLGMISGSYWDKQTSGQNTSSCSDVSFGKTTQQMKTQATFLNWDFDTTWSISDYNNYEYPQLQWQIPKNSIKDNGFFSRYSKLAPDTANNRITMHGREWKSLVRMLDSDEQIEIFDFSGKRVGTISKMVQSFPLKCGPRMNVYFYRIASLHKKIIRSGKLLVL